MKNLFNVLVAFSIVFLTGCSPSAPRDPAQEIPDIIKANMIYSAPVPVKVDTTPAPLPPDVAQSNTILISDVEGCKTYMVTGKATYLEQAGNTWTSEWYKTYFTKCSDSDDVVNEWDVREGKRTIRQTSVTKRITNK